MASCINCAVLIYVSLYSFPFAIAYTCRVPTRLEFVFLVDNSGLLPVQRARDMAPIAEDLSILYNGSKFGIALFSDFECEAWSTRRHCKGAASFHHTDPHACYTFYEKLTTDVQKIKKRLTDKIKVKFSNTTDAGINGLFLTGAETKMRWTRGRGHGGLVRLIVVITSDGTHEDGPTYGTWNGQARRAVKGDGTDKCETMKNAKTQDANRVLAKDQISVYVLIKAKQQSMTDSWRAKLGKMRNVKHRIQSLDEPRQHIRRSIGKFIDELAKENDRVDCDRCAILL